MDTKTPDSTEKTEKHQVDKPAEEVHAGHTKKAGLSQRIKSLGRKKLIIIGVVALLIVVGVLSATVFKGDGSKGTPSAQNAQMMFDYGACMAEQSKAGKDVTAQGEACQALQRKYNLDHGISNDDSAAGNLGDPNSTDPVTRGRALGYGQCTGSGSAKLTHAPMDTKDVETIQPMGLTAAGHVTPVDHEYYYQKNPNAPLNTYPVYAVMDGTITGAGHVGNAWAIFLSHSCTFYADYNLMTDISDSIKSKLPAGWGPNNNGNVKIPVKSGQLIGYVGGQSLDFAVWDTTKFLKGFLNPTAYNNAEPWKINTVHSLDYFTAAVKNDVLTKYVRTAEPRDGRIDYDVDGQAVGNWFLVGSNGYAGGNVGTSDQTYYKGHLSLTYDYIDSKALTFSIGDYNGAPTQFAVMGSVDWTKITPSSGLAKVELAERQYSLGDGSPWSGKFSTDIKMKAGPSKATALVQMTEKQVMKVEVFPGKTPVQVSGFTAAAKTYNRGQDAHMIQSTTATP